MIYDKEFKTIRSFLTKEQFLELSKIDVKNISKLNSFVREKILENHKEIIEWMKNLPYFYETEKQIFVHAGIDEDAGELWKLGTPDYYYVSKYPATKGRFYKDIIAGHISSATVANDIRCLGKVFYDGHSHYYVDGSIHQSKKLPVLVYDVETEEYNAFQLDVGEDFKCY